MGAVGLAANEIEAKSITVKTVKTITMIFFISFLHPHLKVELIFLISFPLIKIKSNSLLL
jgi:hypothetical protein